MINCLSPNHGIGVIDGEIALAQGHGELADAVPSGGVVRTGLGLLEKARAFAGVMAELITEEPQGIGRITEAAGGFRARQLLDEVSAERLIFSMEGRFGGEKAAGLPLVS